MTKRTAPTTLVPRWLRHRRLIATEALLLANAAREAVTQRLTPTLPGWGKVLVTMVAAVGLFGGLFYLLEAIAAKGVAKTHAAVRVVPVPAPGLVVHAAVFVGLFYLYAWLLRVAIWPLAGT